MMALELSFYRRSYVYIVRKGTPSKPLVHQASTLNKQAYIFHPFLKMSPPLSGWIEALAAAPMHSFKD
jgi:hypothetical protein